MGPIDIETILIGALVCGLISACIGASKDADAPFGAAVIWFLIGGLLGPLGIILSLIVGGNNKRCPFCREKMQASAVVCPHCRRDQPQVVVPSASEVGFEGVTTIQCPSCGRLLASTVTKCPFCFERVTGAEDLQVARSEGAANDKSRRRKRRQD
jgi:hypothetical protein